MNAFAPLSDEISNFLRANGMVQFTPIQDKAVPLLFRKDQNALLLAPTGSGKTEAALLPLLHRLQDLKSSSDSISCTSPLCGH